MPVPLRCRNRDCPNHVPPKDPGWRVPHGSYGTLAHGTVQRYRCRACGKTVSDQTESMHYYAKRLLPLEEISRCLDGNTCPREIARRYETSPMAIQGAILRIGRQAMAAHMVLLTSLNPRIKVVFDGLRSFVTSQDYPCDITTVLDPEGETILSMSHAVFRRGGRMTPAQARRMAAKNARWEPKPGTVSRAITQLFNEIWAYLRPSAEEPAVLHSDEDPHYQRLLAADPVMGHYRSGGLIRHVRTPSTYRRTRRNPLFPANYIDRIMRHRCKEHTRESFAFGRHAVLQMHRAWRFAWETNCRRPYRVRHPELGVHAVQGSVPEEAIKPVTKEFFERRIALDGVPVPESIVEVWTAELQSPPVRWRIGQKGSSIRVPNYALRDLEEGILAPRVDEEKAA